MRILRQYKLILKGLRAEKYQIFGKNFPKCSKTAFFTCFFFSSKKCMRRKIFGHNTVFVVFWDCLENQFGRPKSFWKSAPPLEKILGPPLHGMIESRANLRSNAERRKERGELFLEVYFNMHIGRPLEPIWINFNGGACSKNSVSFCLFFFFNCFVCG